MNQKQRYWQNNKAWNFTTNYVPTSTTPSLTPADPKTSSTLNCTFTVTDPDAGDSLSANVSWYRNNTYYSYENVSVTNNTVKSVILGSGNTTTGDYSELYRGNYRKFSTNSSYFP